MSKAFEDHDRATCTFRNIPEMQKTQSAAMIPSDAHQHLQHAYVPFGLGTRLCIGQTFATVELKIVLSLILSKFSFSISPNYHHSPVQKLVLMPEHGIRLLVSRVQAN
ncbi:hypothetical protein M0R45_024812 [Rubus argutus]|uniref:Cytochrome P450 n=1 Tax=Rubus argutus TaxID=59490 RepID=A0AAW1WU92_RUBAR